MIPEQALFHLPEILVGASYPEQRYEGGIVAAYSLALLQALNGRNIPNPISRIHVERAYQREPWDYQGEEKGAKRYLRSDLYLNFKHLGVLNKALSAYGWRRRCRIEAKFFRSSPGTDRSAGLLLADLLRLLALVHNVYVTSGGTRQIDIARYLLHVYESVDPRQHFLPANAGEDAKLRPWLETLLMPGKESCTGVKLSEESQTVKNVVNEKMAELTIGFTTTTWRIEPLVDLGESVRKYTCILNRIDAFKISHGEASLAVGENRTIQWVPNRDEAVAKIRKLVGCWINSAKEKDNQKPDQVELPSDDDTDTK